MFFCFSVDVCSWNHWIVSPILLNELFTWIKILGHLASSLKKEPRLGMWITTPILLLASNEAEKDPLSGRWLGKVVICISDGLWLACAPSSLPAPLADAWLWESTSPWLHLLEDAAAPWGRRTRAVGALPPSSDSRAPGGIKSTCRSDVCRSDVCCVLQTLARGLQTAALTQPSPLPNPFFAPEGFHNKHSSEATLNLLKENLFIRELGWMSEIIIIGGYLQQEDEKER